MNIRLIVLGLICALPLQGQKAPIRPPVQQPAPGRYQLVSLELNDHLEKTKSVFLLDSQTGRVWRYQPFSAGTTNDNKPINFPEVFLPIEIWQPKEGVKVSPDDF